MRVEEFVYKMFKGFDNLEPSEWFLSQMSSDFKLKTPDANYEGHNGFRSWYEEVKKDLLPPTEHNVKYLKTKKLEDKLYEANFTVEFKATTKNSEEIFQKVFEYWLLEETASGSFLIKEYVISINNKGEE